MHATSHVNFGCKILHMHLSSAAVFVAAAMSVMQTSSKQIVNVGPAPVGPYSVAVKADGLIYLSGTLSQNDAGDLVGCRRRAHRPNGSSSG